VLSPLPEQAEVAVMAEVPPPGTRVALGRVIPRLPLRTTKEAGQCSRWRGQGKRAAKNVAWPELSHARTVGANKGAMAWHIAVVTSLWVAAPFKMVTNGSWLAKAR